VLVNLCYLGGCGEGAVGRGVGSGKGEWEGGSREEEGELKGEWGRGRGRLGSGEGRVGWGRKKGGGGRGKGEGGLEYQIANRLSDSYNYDSEFQHLKIILATC